MKSKFTDKLYVIFEKLKNNRRLQILLFIAITLIIIICYFSFSSFGFKEDPLEKVDQDISTSNYVEYLEEKLEKSLRSLEGVTDATVMITLESGFEYVYATDEETKTTSSGTLTTSSLVLVSGQPVVEKEIYPIIKGVVVVASAAKDIQVKLNILSLIQTILEVPNEKITILN